MAEKTLATARVASLFSVARPAYYATIVNAGLLLLVLWETLPVALLIGWLAVLLAITLARVGLHRAYMRDASRHAPARWESWFALGAIAAGALWTYPSAIFLAASDPLLQMAVMFVVGGTIIGATGVYAPSPAAFYGFCTLPFFGIVVQLVQQPGRTYSLLALMVAVFGVVMVRVYRDIHGSVVSTLRTQIENDSLLTRLAQSEGQLRDSIAAVSADRDELRLAREAYGRLVVEEQLMLDTLPVGVAFLAERVIVRCNRRLEQMLGYAPGELNGKSSRVLYANEEVWQEAGESYSVLRGGKVQEGDMRLRRKDGSLLWCSVVARAASPEAPQASTILVYTDVSERHDTERALRRSEAMYRNLVETSNDLIWSVDAAGRWTYLSPAAAGRIYGSRPQELIGREFRDVLAHEVTERDLAVFRRILAGESVFDFQTRHLRSDGVHVDLSFNAIPLRDAKGAVVGATGTARDVTAEKVAAAAQYENVEKLRLAVDTAELEYWEWDRASGSMHFGRAPGDSQPGTKRRSFDDWLRHVHEDDRERCRVALLATQEQGAPYEIDFRIHAPSDEVRWMHSRGKAILDADGEVTRVIGVSQDITERKRQEEEARFLAYHDTLTGLPNRRLLDDRLGQALFLAQRRDTRVGVMVIDLDRFKQVNDALGHRAGDAVLREAAHRIVGCVRKADTLARHGGDEFVVVIPDLRQDGDCQVVAEKILRSLEPAFVVDGREFTIGASIGVSIYPADAGDGDGVLRNADAAMYRAKQLGRNNYRFYGR